MADEDWTYTTEPVRGGYFLGAITLEMVERAAEALCKEDGGDGEGCECMAIHRRDANAALHAALSSPSSGAATASSGAQTARDLPEENR